MRKQSGLPPPNVWIASAMRSHDEAKTDDHIKGECDFTPSYGLPPNPSGSKLTLLMMAVTALPG